MTAKNISTSAQQEVEALRRTLRETQQRIRELTGGDLEDGDASSEERFRARETRSPSTEKGAKPHSLEATTLILNVLPAHIALLDHRGVITSANEGWRRFAEVNALGISRSAEGMSYLEVCERAAGNSGGEAQQAADGIRAVLAGGRKSFSMDYPCHSTTEQRWFRLMVSATETEGLRGAVVMHVNITERKMAEFRLLRLNRLHTVLSKVGEAIVRTRDRQELFETVCQIVVNDGLLRMAFVAEVDEVTGEVRKAASYGACQKYLQTLSITTDGGAQSQGTVGRALRTGTYDVCNDFLNDPRMQPWRQKALDHGFHATASFAIKLGEKVIGALVLFAGEIGYFQDDEIRLMVDVANDLSFALEAQQKDEQRRIAENALIASETNMAVAQQIAHFASWELELPTEEEPIGRLTWSDEMFRIAGFSPKEMPVTRELFFSLVHPDDRELIRKAVADAIRDRKAYTVVHRMIRPSGEERVVHETAQLYFDEKTGRAWKMIGTTHDITERRKAELELDRTRAQYLGLVESVDGIVWEADAVTFAFTFVSTRVEQILGFPLARWLNEPKFWANCIHPEDRSEAVEYCIRQTGKKADHVFEYRMVAADGRIVWVRDIVTYVEEWDKPALLRGIMVDITEQKLATENLRCSEALIRMSSRLGRMGAWVIELPDKRVRWSDELYTILDVPPGEPLPMERGLDLYLPEYRDEIRSAVTTCEQVGTPFDLEVAMRTETGRLLWARVAGECVRDAAGSIIRVQGAFQDITERKRSEEESRQLAERLAHTLENLPDGFCTLDREWRFTYLNTTAEGMFQRPRTELLGRVIWEAFPQLRGSDFEREYVRALREDVFVQFEEFYPPFGGWLGVRVYPSAHGLGIYFHDVTEQRVGREALLLSEERFRLMAKATNDAVWDWDMVTNALWWNEGFETLFGYRRSEVEPTRDAWSTRVHPNDREEILADIRRAVEAGDESWSAEYRFRCKDGSDAFVLDRGHVIRNADGQPIRMIGGMTDLTERIRAEQRIAEQAALIDEALDSIIVRDPQDRITYWNRSAERLYGWNSEEVLGQSLRELCFPDPASFDEAKDRVLKHNEWIGELSMAGKDARQITVESRWTLVRDHAGQPRSVLAINTDITARKRVEQQLLRAQRMESIGTLAGGIAHDLNNVLGPIIMSLDLMKMRFGDPESQELISIIGSSARRGADMVSQVLSFARGVEGRRLEVQVTHLVRDIEKIANDTFLKHIRVRTVVAADLWTVIGDPTQLHQVLLNLCVNSRDAMPNGGTLTVSVANTRLDQHYAALSLEATPGPYVAIQIEDTGIGMAPDVIDKIFDPFFTTKDVGKGTGLGLSTSLAIIKSHAGFIRVQSEQGKGTKFEVYLPAQTEPSGTIPVETEVELPRGNDELILVVDDELSVRQITRQTLEAFGYRVILASDGADAVAIFAKRGGEIAAMLTDMMMPGIDGPATIQVLRKMNPDLPIIAASGLSTEVQVAKATNLGVKHFLSKPYTAETLLKVLRQILSGG